MRLGRIYEYLSTVFLCCGESTYINTGVEVVLHIREGFCGFSSCIMYKPEGGVGYTERNIETKADNCCIRLRGFLMDDFGIMKRSTTWLVLQDEDA